nr:hypothetical protein [Tanacetum cinerariifolium]
RPTADWHSLPGRPPRPGLRRARAARAGATGRAGRANAGYPLYLPDHQLAGRRTLVAHPDYSHRGYLGAGCVGALPAPALG